VVASSLVNSGHTDVHCERRTWSRRVDDGVDDAAGEGRVDRVFAG